MSAAAVDYRSYTAARRHELVAGNLGIKPKTTEQLVVGIALFLLLYVTRPLWATELGATELLVLGGAPAGVMAVLPRAQRDGRSPLRIAAGWVTLAVAPRSGTINGRPLRALRPRRFAVLTTVEPR